MNEQIEAAIQGLNSEMNLLEDGLSPLERVSKADNLLENAEITIFGLADRFPFDDENDEINYYKHLLPGVLALRILEGLRYSITINRPISTNDQIIEYYSNELSALENFYRLNSFHYQYFKNEYRELDKLYFLRDADPLSIPIPELPPTERKCPPMSYLFGKFIAYEKAQRFILEQINKLEHLDLAEITSVSTVTSAEMRWTGDVINLVELLYGLWLTGQLNNGNISMNQLVRWTEENLHVTIGIIQKRFTEIERRKRLSNTRFLDQMRNALIQKIDNANA